VTAWLSAEWVAGVQAAAADLPPVPGLTGTVELVVTGGPGGEVRLPFRYAAGQPQWDDHPGEADVTLTMPAAEARSVLLDDGDPTVGFMQGRVKTAGDNGELLRWLRSTSSPEWREWRATISRGIAD
jgi:SCP-2 sterol transfer family